MTKTGTIYAITDNEGHVIYIGVDTSKAQDRIDDHLKPSKYKDQDINRFMQDYPEQWQALEIIKFEAVVDIKELGHALEAMYIQKFQPRFNNYLIQSMGVNDILKELEKSK